MKKLYLFVVAFAFSSILSAQWVSPGDGTTYTFPDLIEVSHGVVGNTPSFPVNFGIHANLTISENDVLIIDDQVSHITAQDVLITIKGSLICENSNRVEIGASQTNPFSIRFENATACDIKNMCFSLGGGIKIIESEVTFDNVEFVYFTRDYCNSVIDIQNCDPIIKNCNFTINEGSAISSPANGQSSPQILNCRFSYIVTSNANMPQINLGPGAQDSIRIMNCSIEGFFDMSGGISIADLTGTGETKILLKDNIIKNNRYGYNQQGYNLCSVIIGNQFIDNNLETNPMNGGSGISIYGYSTECKAIIRDNTITGNLWGITAIYLHDIDLGTEDDWGNNLIKDNGNDGVIYDLYNNSACDITAVGNNWGTSNANEIEEHIYHQYDNPEFGLVNYIPFVDVDAIEETVSTSIEVAPNPVLNGSFALTTNEETPSELMIYNLQGQCVKSQSLLGNTHIIHVEELTSGLYFIIFKQAERIVTKKLIIQ